MLLGGRLGDTIGRKRTFIVGIALFTIASALCGIAWDEATLVIARLLQGIGAAIASPTALALIATTFPKGPARNAATAVFGAMTGVGSVMGLVVGGALTEVSWRLAFLVNVPIGLLTIYLARTTLRETVRERMKLDATGPSWPRWSVRQRCSRFRWARRRGGSRSRRSVRAWWRRGLSWRSPSSNAPPRTR
ncbi:sugar (and other) transporter family protein [Mycobacterium xenopi 4042]|uniref:Sugar (And other) transporter family protein n=1 Tax=Mycobacterium xenopi 4042 TaxID=1299334 RepID=X8E5Y5_MYCXE|nr:sugar (and other) transporter family protein [Mycobacterium xenopi 4042]